MKKTLENPIKVTLTLELEDVATFRKQQSTQIQPLSLSAFIRNTIKRFIGRS